MGALLHLKPHAQPFTAVVSYWAKAAYVSLPSRSCETLSINSVIYQQLCPPIGASAGLAVGFLSHLRSDELPLTLALAVLFYAALL